MVGKYTGLSDSYLSVLKVFEFYLFHLQNMRWNFLTLSRCRWKIILTRACMLYWWLVFVNELVSNICFDNLFGFDCHLRVAMKLPSSYVGHFDKMVMESPTMFLWKLFGILIDYKKIRVSFFCDERIHSDRKQCGLLSTHHQVKHYCLCWLSCRDFLRSMMEH